MIKKTILDLSIGSPAFLHRYWEGAGASITFNPCDSMDYLHGAHHKLVGEIVRAHSLLGNVDLSGNYQIVVTNGATQALMAAMYAFRQLGKPEMWASRPYWFRFPEIAYLAGCSWSTDAAPTKVRVVTCPNNPDNYSSLVMKRMVRNTITDCCYNWPHYTKNVKKIDQIVTIFSLAKMTGHAGSRIGWAIVKDGKIAALMNSFVEHATGGVSVEAQLRAATVIDYETTNVQTQRPSVFDWGQAELARRWDAFLAAVPLEIEILNSVDKGMFAWCGLKRSGNAASYILGRYNVKVLSGALCGSTNNRFRVNLGCTEEEFAELVSRLLTR